MWGWSTPTNAPAADDSRCATGCCSDEEWTVVEPPAPPAAEPTAGYCSERWDSVPEYQISTHTTRIKSYAEALCAGPFKVGMGHRHHAAAGARLVTAAVRQPRRQADCSQAVRLPRERWGEVAFHYT